MALRGRTILVTGGAGFIGSHLVDRLLVEGARVIVVDDLTTGTLSNLGGARRDYPGSFEFQRLSVTSDGLQAVFDRHRPELVAHLATPQPPLDGIDAAMSDALVAAVGTVNVLEQLARARGSGIVLLAPAPVQHAAADGEIALSGPATTLEHAGMNAAEAYARAFQTLAGIRATTLVVDRVYGPRQHPDGRRTPIATFAQALVANRACSISHNAPHDFVFVDDVVEALVTALDRGPATRIPIATGTKTRPSRILKALATVTGGGDNVLSPPHHGPRLETELLDRQPAQEHLDFATWTPLEEGLATTLRWVSEQHAAVTGVTR